MARVPGLTRFARLPIRARLTVAFAGVIAIVLAAAGVFLYAQFQRDLDAQIDEALNLEARDIAALVHSAGPAAVVSSDEERAQVYAGDGRLLASTREAAG
jgi:hypothetical protein